MVRGFSKGFASLISPPFRGCPASLPHHVLGQPLTSAYQLLTNALSGCFEECWWCVPLGSNSQPPLWPCRHLARFSHCSEPLTSPKSLSLVPQSALMPQEHGLWARWRPQTVTAPIGISTQPVHTLTMPRLSVVLKYTIAYLLAAWDCALVLPSQNQGRYLVKRLPFPVTRFLEARQTKRFKPYPFYKPRAQPLVSLLQWQDLVLP